MKWSMGLNDHGVQLVPVTRTRGLFSHLLFLHSIASHSFGPIGRKVILQLSGSSGKAKLTSLSLSLIEVSLSLINPWLWSCCRLWSQAIPLQSSCRIWFSVMCDLFVIRVSCAFWCSWSWLFRRVRLLPPSLPNWFSSLAMWPPRARELEWEWALRNAFWLKIFWGPCRIFVQFGLLVASSGFVIAHPSTTSFYCSCCPWGVDTWLFRLGKLPRSGSLGERRKCFDFSSQQWARCCSVDPWQTSTSSRIVSSIYFEIRSGAEVKFSSEWEGNQFSGWSCDGSIQKVICPSWCSMTDRLLKRWRRSFYPDISCPWIVCFEVRSIWWHEQTSDSISNSSKVVQGLVIDASIPSDSRLRSDWAHRIPLTLQVTHRAEVDRSRIVLFDVALEPFDGSAYQHAATGAFQFSHQRNVSENVVIHVILQKRVTEEAGRRRCFETSTTSSWESSSQSRARPGLSTRYRSSHPGSYLLVTQD